jgi:hypothetical protein
MSVSCHNRTHAPQQSWDFNGNTLVTSSSTLTGSLRHLQAKTAGTLKTPAREVAVT